MKKLILAPAVALAFTGLVAAPVAAAEAPSSSTQSGSAAAKAEQVKKEKAEKLAKEEKAAEEKAAQEKKEKAAEAAEAKAEAKKAAAEEEAADNKKADEKAGDDAEKSEKPAPEDGDSKDSKTDNDSDAKDDDKNAKDSEEPNDSSDEVENINASLRVATSSISAEDLASVGVKVTVTGLEKGDKLTTSGLSAPATTVTADGSKSITLDYSGDAEDLKEGKKSFAVKVQREGVAAQTLSGSTNVKTQDAIESELSVDPEEITPEDLADPNKGIQVTVTNLEEGDTVTDDLTNKPKTVDADGTFSFNVYHEGSAEELEEGKHPFTVTIDREGEESVTLDGEINIVDEVAEVDPKVSLSTDEISESDFNKDGITVTGTGFTPNGDVKINAGAGNSFFQDETVTADNNGEITVPITAPGSGLAPGRYTVTATDVDSDKEAAEQTFTITEDAVEAIDASLTVDPKEITAEDLANKDKGVTVTVSGVKKGDKITDSLTGDTETATADGDYKLHLYYQGNPDSLEEGKVPLTVTIDREGTESETLKGNINVVAEDDGDAPEAPAEASFSVSPQILEAADFANEKKGVTLSVENCEPGADVHFEVNPKGIQVTAYENTVKADDEGKASVNVFGTSENVSAYIGSYTANATCGDDTMKASFKVTAGADGGGSGSDGNDNGNGSGGNTGDDGSQLPRTGADLGGIASGAILLLVGGAAIAMTGRRKKVGQSPSDF